MDLATDLLPAVVLGVGALLALLALAFLTAKVKNTKAAGARRDEEPTRSSPRRGGKAPRAKPEEPTKSHGGKRPKKNKKKKGKGAAPSQPVEGKKDNSNKKRKLSVGELVKPLRGRPVRKHLAANNQPPPIVDNQDDAENFIIDSPVATMGLVLEDGQVAKSTALGLDLEKMYDDVIKACEVDPSSRKKPLLAVMRGIGGGKTRTLTEFWLYVLSHHRHLLALPVTFNNKTMAIDDVRLLKGADVETRVCLSLALRVLHALYDVRYADLLELLAPVVRNCIATKEVLGEVLAFACERVNRERAGTAQVTHAVLMVDEAVRLVELFGDSEEDVGEILRRGVLELACPKFHLALAISSLSTSFVAETGSGHSVWPVHIPETLNAKHIVKDWWRLSPNSLALEWLADAVSASPRATECALVALRRVLEKRNSLGLEELKHTWTEVQAEVGRRYAVVSVPLELWSKALFEEEVGVRGDDAKRMLLESVFVNVPESYSKNATFVPKMSAAMLHRMKFAKHENLTSLVQRLVGAIFGHLNDTERMKRGALLEAFMREWLQVLVLTAVLHPPVQLKALLGLSGSVPHLEHAIHGFLYETSETIRNLNSNNEHHREALVNALSEVVVDDPVVFSAHGEEAFDGMVAMRIGNRNQVHVVLLECKSRKVMKGPVTQGPGTEKDRATVPIANTNALERQAVSVHRLAQLCRKHKNQPGSVAEALAAGRWTMVFIDNDKEPKLRSVASLVLAKRATDGWVRRLVLSLIGDGEVESAGWVVRLGRAQRKRFFGPLLPLYTSMRAALDVLAARK